MARLKNRRKRKRILRRVLHVCVILAVLFVAAKGAAFIGKDSSEPIEKAVVMNVFGKDGHDAPEAKEVSAVLTDREAYPQDYLDALENNPELLPFVKGYPDADKTATGGLEKKELDAQWPLLLQWDKRWGYVPYGDHDIGLSGCAPTCLSMVVVGLTRNQEATPDAVAEFAEQNGYYLYGTGTKWSLMTEGAVSFGVQGRELALDKSRIFTALEQGHPVICSVRPGDFTKGGHFLVLVGVEDGKIRLNDPNSRIRSEKLWDYETLAPQIKSLWEFTAG